MTDTTQHDKEDYYEREDAYEPSEAKLPLPKHDPKEEELARLTAHIRAIAEHHDKQINFVESSDDIDYQTMRRDFALSGLEKP